MSRRPLVIIAIAALFGAVLANCEQSPGGDLCGNGVPDPGETHFNCPEDIADPCNHDGYCDPGESVMLCPNDVPPGDTCS